MALFERIRSRWRKYRNRRPAWERADGPKRGRGPFVEALEDRVLLATVDLSPSKDNTLIEVPTGASQFLSDGAGQDFFVGRTKQPSGQAIRRGLIAFDVASGIPAANYIGSGGLDARSDIAGLNLAQYPSILIECGNMKNPADSALMKTAEGQQKYADAVVRGIAAFLATQPARTA